jgi:hypothetical protein
MRTMGLMALGAMLASGVVGSGCSESGSGPVTPPVPDLIDITGKVVDGDLYPLAGVPVLVSGHPQVTTDANGQFSVSGVERPYDVATAFDPLRLGVVYRNLTRPDPVLSVSVRSLVTNQTVYGDVSGTVSGGEHPDSFQYRTGVLFASPEATHSTLADPSGAFQMGFIGWRGSSTTTGTIHALQSRFDETTRLPAEYTGYGTRSGVVLSPGANLTEQDVHMTPVADLTISGTVTVPNSYRIVSHTLLAGFGPAPTAAPVWTVLSDHRRTSEFEYVAPNLPGAALTLRTFTRAEGGAPQVTVARSVTSANAAGLSIVVPPGPELAAPADGATGLTAGATLAWRKVPDAVYIVSILEEGTSIRTRYNVITADTAVVVPDLEALGLPLGAGMSYSWLVSAIGPFASLDDAAGSTTFFLPGDSSSGVSAARRFTTAP